VSHLPFTIRYMDHDDLPQRPPQSADGARGRSGIRYCVASAEVRDVQATGWRPSPAPLRSRPTVRRPVGVLHAFDLELDEALCGVLEVLHIFTNASWGGPLGKGTLCEDCFSELVTRLSEDDPPN